MLNAVYRLVAPRRFEVEFTDIDLTAGNVIVRPTYLSCRSEILSGKTCGRCSASEIADGIDP